MRGEREKKKEKNKEKFKSCYHLLFGWGERGVVREIERKKKRGRRGITGGGVEKKSGRKIKIELIIFFKPAVWPLFVVLLGSGGEMGWGRGREGIERAKWNERETERQRDGDK